MFPGLSTRIYNELAEIMTKRKYSGKKSQFNSIGLRVHDPPRRKNAVFHERFVVGTSFGRGDDGRRKMGRRWIGQYGGRR